eukprot:13525711-Heterocapsa_arctica.AAC.1
MSTKDEENITEYDHTMRISYEAQDRQDLSCASASLLRTMKTFCKSSWESLKSVGRYLRGALVRRTTFSSHSIPEVEEAFSDSDHAGDPTSTQSRSGRAVSWVWHLVRHGGAEQSAIILSSGESKHYATIRAM